MKRLEQLPEAAQRGLAGLTAGQNLKYRILHEAAQGAKPRRRVPAWAPALCCALVLALAVAFALPALNAPPQDPAQLISSQPAGSVTQAPQMTAQGGLTGGSITSNQGVPAYRSLWESGSGGNFPLLGVKGSYYRLLSSPDSVDGSLLGNSLGAVEEYTTEPALSGTDVVLSNLCASGTEVYEISGMGGTLVAAQVNGVMRAFQRVGFNGAALNGRESLGDTLQISGHATMLELSGVGTVSDAATVDALVSTLLQNAMYESSGSVSGDQSLLIDLDNGLTIQMAVKNDKLSACGTWSCPEFFDAFAAAAE